METPEEFFGSNDQIHNRVLKGRRTKRQRANSSTCGGAATVSSASSSGGGAEDQDFASSSSTNSGEMIDHREISAEEEEDMANCLILLAQGDGRPSQTVEESVKFEGIMSSKRFSEMAGFYVYECKTCNRTFPSFQALGGHRASHKKPKSTLPAAVSGGGSGGEDKMKRVPILIARDEMEEAKLNRAASLQGNKAKIHECSICGLEFTSGQALGGHMRRHRVVSNTAPAVAMKTAEIKERNILELDLNLPAPEEDLREGKFQFTATPQTIVFSAPTLVDCHY